MDADLRQRMLAYYDQRAPEYEEAFTRGTGTASIQAPEVFKADARVLPGIVRRFARGRIIDVACGTAFWRPETRQTVLTSRCAGVFRRLGGGSVPTPLRPLRLLRPLCLQ